NNKKIVVIGGTSGMGLSAAKFFLQQGAKVVAVGRNEDTCRKAQDEMDSLALAVSGDAIHEGTASQAIELCVEKWGGFDGLYHVAGGSGRKMGDGPLHEMTMEGWNKTLELNLTSVMLSNRAAVRFFLSQKTG